MRRILCLHLPNWPIQRVLAGPDVGQVCVLHARDPRRGQIVVAASDPARQCGIRLGMPLAEAATLANRSPHAPRQEFISRSEMPTMTLPHDPATDLAELARLAEHCERFSPLVGWETAESRGQRSEVRGQRVSTLKFESGTLNSLFLDVTGIGVLFGGEDRLAGEVVAEMARLGYTARVAVADTIGAAWAWANWEGEAPAEPGLEVGGRRSEAGADSSGSVPVPRTQYSVLSTSLVPNPPFRAPSSALRTLPLTALRLPFETLDLLSQLGLKQIADLLALPRTSLQARFGELVLLRLDQLTGAAQETIVAHRPPPKFAAEWLLEYPAERREVIDQIVHELVGRIAAALAERREGVVQLHCRLDCAPGQPVRMEVGLFRPSADARHLWDLVRMQLDQLRLPGPVGRVTLQAVTTAPLENRQALLFAGGKGEADRQLALLIDRLASRLGPEAVLHPQLTSDPLPEKAVKCVRTIHADRSKVQSPRSKVKRPWTLDLGLWTDSPRSSMFRPLFLRPPLPLDTVSVVPDGPPITFRFQGRLHHVAHHWGPERIETGWFRGASVRRDYYRVETEEGLHFWLFRRLDDGRWHLHGEFS